VLDALSSASQAGAEQGTGTVSHKEDLETGPWSTTYCTALALQPSLAGWRSWLPSAFRLVQAPAHNLIATLAFKTVQVKM